MSEFLYVLLDQRKGAGVGKKDAQELNVEGGGGKAGIKCLRQTNRCPAKALCPGRRQN